MHPDPDTTSLPLRPGEEELLERGIARELAISAVPLLPWELARRVHAQTGLALYRILAHLRRELAAGRLELIDGKIAGQGRGEVPLPADIAAVMPPKPDWTLFHRLVQYYIRCLQADNGYSPGTWQDRLSEDFVFLDQYGHWYPTPGRPWEMFIRVTDTRHNVRQIWKGNGADLVLGYPVAATFSKKAGEVSVALTPIFCYQLAIDKSAAGMHVATVSRQPFVNGRWLAQTFKYQAARQHFLQTCGLQTSAPETAEDEAPSPGGYLDPSAPGPDFRQLAALLGNVVAEQIREPLDPDRLVCTPLPQVSESHRNGIYNRALLVCASPAPYVRRLVDELQEIDQASEDTLNQTALRAFFTDFQDDHTPVSEGSVAEVYPLNPDQRSAIASLLSAPVSVIQGPPGTGKSQVVAAAAVNARLADKTVLISSYNHKAIDAVLSKLVAPDGTALAVRANSRDAQTPDCKFHQALKKMLAQPFRAKHEEDFRARHEAFERLVRERCEYCAIGEEHARHAEELGRLEATRQSLIARLPAWLVPHLACGATQKGFGKKHLEQTRRFLDRFGDEGKCLLLAWLAHPVCGLRFFRFLKLVHPKQDQDQTQEQTQSLAAPHRPRFGLLDRLTRRDMQALADCCRLALELVETCGHKLALARQIAQEEKSLTGWEARFAAVNADIQKLLPDLVQAEAGRREGVQEMQRRDLAFVQKALSGLPNTLENGLAYASPIEQALQRVPVWAVTSLSVGKFLPLVPGMFDLALLDEAGQSNIPSALPILFRAKRVGVIGDPNQLRFITALSVPADIQFMREKGLDPLACRMFSFADNSLYDFASSAACAKGHLLSATFRSAAEIVAYCNQFYDGRLAVATNEDSLRVPKGHKKGIEWSDVAGTIRHRVAGSTYCDEEIEAVALLVLEFMESGFEGTIGIVTPFREQAARIQEYLYGTLRLSQEETEKFNLHVNTAHGYQGDERDVILMSLCAGPDITPGALRFLEEGGNLFNVAASRARALFHVVGNKTWAANCGIRHIATLASPEQTGGRGPRHTPWSPYESPYEKYLAEELKARTGLEPIPQFPLRSRRLDLALVDPGRSCKLDIEVDGACHLTAGGTRKMDDHWRDQEVRDQGWEVVRFWTYELDNDIGACVRKVEQMWSALCAHAEETGTPVSREQ